jgi:hypothetical protein
MDDIWNLVISLRIVGKISKRREREGSTRNKIYPVLFF